MKWDYYGQPGRPRGKASGSWALLVEETAFWVASDLPLEASEQGLDEPQVKCSVSALSENELKEFEDPDVSDVCCGYVRPVKQKSSWPSPIF